MTARTKFATLLTCEHGGNQVPAEYQYLFASKGAQRDLRSHRGYDPGALRLAESLADTLQCELHAAQQSRLLIELNRSLDSRELFSRYSQDLDAAERQKVIAAIYQPFRGAVAKSVNRLVRQRRCVVHFSIHTFTPRYRGAFRDYDIGVLFDPTRAVEARLSHSILAELSARGFEAHANRPYLGTDDGHTTQLRTRYSAEEYTGIEIEVNNRFAKFSERTQYAWSQRIGEAIKSELS